MFRLRLKDDRGKTKTAWLDSAHTFSFSGYFDHNHMGFSDLRVINDDYIMAGAGFGEHPHESMEIISIVLKGVLEHKDSMGNATLLSRGDVQRMSAGRGVFHSEYNPSKDEYTHFLQIWIMTNKPDIESEYEQKRFSVEEEPDVLHLIASQDGRNNSLTIHQDVEIYQASLNVAKTLSCSLCKERKTWIHIAEGSVKIKDHRLEEGDAIAISDEEADLCIEGASEKSNLIIFNLRNLP